MTSFEIYVNKLRKEYLSNPEEYDRIIGENKEKFLTQCLGKFDIDKSFSDEEIRKWVTEIRNKHGQRLADGFITFYIFHNIVISGPKNNSENNN